VVGVVRERTGIELEKKERERRGRGRGFNTSLWVNESCKISFHFHANHEEARS